MNDAMELWEKAKELKIKISLMNSQFFEKFQMKYPDAFKNLGSLTNAYNRHNLNDEILNFVQDFFVVRNKMMVEMNEARTKSERLFEEIRNQDKRILLDPRKDGTPVGEYPKLKQCVIYPLRLDCNYGSNNNSKWERCEFMKYDSSKSIFDSSRWICTYKE